MKFRRLRGPCASKMTGRRWSWLASQRRRAKRNALTYARCGCSRRAVMQHRRCKRRPQNPLFTVEYVASFSEYPSSLHAVRHLPEVDEVLVDFIYLRESLAYRARSTHLCEKRPRNRDDNNCRTQHDDQSKHQIHDGANLDSSCRQ